MHLHTNLDNTVNFYSKWFFGLITDKDATLAVLNKFFELLNESGELIF